MFSRTIVAGDTVTFAFATWFVAAVALAGVALLALGLQGFRRKKPWRAWFDGAAVVLGLVAAAGIAPVMASDRVIVDTRGIRQTTGASWTPRTIGFVFDELVRVDIEPEHWHFQRKDGQSTELDPGDLWKLNSSAIAELLRQRGVPVTSLRPVSRDDVRIDIPPARPEIET